MIARTSSLPGVIALVGLGLATACPQRVAPEVAKSEAKASAGDPRVVHDTDDLYAHAPAPAPEPEATPADGPGPGSGVPDETNGVCRLYAPKLLRPECCALDLGFDVNTVERACGLPLYLGESVQASCGYHFKADEDPASKGRWFRLSFTLQPTTKEAARAHDERIGFRVADDPTFHSDPIPGVKDGYWSRHGELRWAFIPGWSRPRLLSWNADSCGDEGILEVIRALAKTPEVPATRPRTSLIPGGSPTPSAAG